MKNTNKGYTVIELLTVTGVLVVISSLLTGIMVSTLRGTSKTQTTSSVAQNGNYALSVVSNIIVSSDAVIGLYDSTGQILDENGDCTASPQGNELELRRIDGGITTLSCENNTIASKSASLSLSLLDTTEVQIDTNDASACYFKCVQEVNDPYSSPSIEVGFRLHEKSNSALFEKQATADFKTSVTLRNYSP